MLDLRFAAFLDFLLQRLQSVGRNQPFGRINLRLSTD